MLVLEGAVVGGLQLIQQAGGSRCRFSREVRLFNHHRCLLGAVRYADRRLSPRTFCDRTRDELAVEHSDDGWVRGARAVCELYADVEPVRFEAILTTLATGRTGSAIADGARWLLPRWHTSL